MRKFILMCALIIGASCLFGVPLMAKERKSCFSASFSLNLSPRPVVVMPRAPVIAPAPVPVVAVPYTPYYYASRPRCYYQHVVYVPSYSQQVMIANPPAYHTPFFHRVSPHCR